MEFRTLKETDGKYAAGIALLAIFAVMLGIFLVLTPKYSDDYSFMSNLRGWYEQQGIWYPTDGGNIWQTGIPWDDMVSTWCERYKNDNRRLSNVTVVFFELLPKWVGAGLAWLSWCYAMWGMLRLSRIRMGQLATVSVFIFLCMVVIPWRDNMGCMDYQFNYVLPSGMAVWVLLRLNSGGKGFLYHCVTILLAVLMGAWTEAFSVPILAGLIFIVIFDRKSRCVAMWETVIGLGAGIVWLLSCPNFGARAANEMFTHGVDLKFLLKMVVMELPGISLLAVMSVLYIYFKGWRNAIRNSRLMFTLVSAAVSFGICYLTLGTLRSGWWSALVSVYGVTYMLNCLTKGCLRRRTPMAVATVVTMTGLVWGALIPLDIYVVKTAGEYRKAVRSFLDNPETEIFVDARSDMSLPFLSHNFSTKSLYWEWARFQNFYYFGGGKENVDLWRIVPEGLCNFRPEEGEALGGNMGAILSGNFLVIPFSGKTPMTGYADIGFGPMEKKGVLVRIIPFRSKADGKEYGYVILWDRMIEYHLFGIDYVSNLKRFCRNSMQDVCAHEGMVYYEA